jgi:hypothetical protein
MLKLRSGLTYANVMATIAVFLALGGGAYAALKLPKNSVGARQIKEGAVGSSEVENGSLLKHDFKAGQLPAGPQGPQGLQGPQGDKGVQGNKGDQGVPGEPATKLFAHVTAFTGSLQYGSGAVSSTHTGSAGSGTYTVTFNRDLSGCVALATAGTGLGGQSAISQFSPGVVATTQFTDGNTVQVETTSNGNHNDYDFNLAVFC